MYLASCQSDGHGRDGDTIDTILRVADERTYDAKHQGRNRVVAA
jgi:two-component system cell cycle response regulator